MPLIQIAVTNKTLARDPQRGAPGNVRTNFNHVITSDGEAQAEGLIVYPSPRPEEPRQQLTGSGVVSYTEKTWPRPVDVPVGDGRVIPAGAQAVMMNVHSRHLDRLRANPLLDLIIYGVVG